MILPHTYAAILVLMIFSTLCWGSWANAFKLTGKGRFELFYFDFALGFMALALIYAFTAGNWGFDGFSFLDDVLHAGKRQWAYGFGGGMIFTLANMLLLAAVSVAGMSLAFPVGMGIALILGGMLSYFGKPSGSFGLMMAGFVLILIAVIVNIVAHGALNRLRHEKLARSGLAKSTRRPTKVKGVVLALAGGLLMGAYLPLVQRAMEGEIGLGPYAMCVFFALGALISTFAFNMFFMNLPVEGEPLDLFSYFKVTPKNHAIGFLGGAIACTALLAGLIASFANSEPGSGGGLALGAMQISEALGSAVALAAPLIAAFWGIAAWRELQDADSRVKTQAALMFVLFLGGIALVSLALGIVPKS